MQIDLIRFFAINLFISYIFFKLLNDIKTNVLKKSIIILTSFTLAIFQSYICNYVTNIFIFPLVLSYFLYSFIIGRLAKINYGYSLIIMMICSSVAFLIHYISAFISALLLAFIFILFHINYNELVPVIFSLFIETIAIILLFKINRFKNGFPFLKTKRNDYYFNSFIVIICMNILFIYFLMLNYHSIPFKDTCTIIVTFILVLATTIYKAFIIYQKQKLLEKTVKEYEQELSESNTKLETVLKEKDSLIKANHEFYHRQKALSLKLDTLMKNPNKLFQEEYGSLVERVNSLSTEYNEIIANNEVSGILPKCNIPEIDDMFIYLKSECDKNNIEFTLKLTCDIYQLVNNIIPKNKLETLIGDLIRNSIIAINYGTSSTRAIMVMLGIKDNVYEFSVYDSGINFEIDTLLKLGKERATTHADNGGTGIGFITTFETLKYCDASLIITEFSDDNFNYTKSITIRFDGENNYIVETYRADDFSKSQISRDGMIIRK